MSGTQTSSVQPAPPPATGSPKPSTACSTTCCCQRIMTRPSNIQPCCTCTSSIWAMTRPACWRRSTPGSTPRRSASTPRHHRHAAAGPNGRSIGQTINFGGVSTADNAGETNAIAALKQVMSQYSSDPSRVYVTGNSMGGIGTEDMLIKFNAYTGTEGKIFAAGLALAGADYGQGYPQPNASVVTRAEERAVLGDPWRPGHPGAAGLGPEPVCRGAGHRRRYEIHPGQQPGTRRLGHLLPPDPAPARRSDGCSANQRARSSVTPPPATRCPLGRTTRW